MAVATIILPGACCTGSAVNPHTHVEADITDLAHLPQAQYVTLATDAGLGNERVLVGTVNRVIVTDGGAGGNVTLSTPQDIHSGASPTFAALTLSGTSTPVFSFTNINPGTDVEVGRFIGFSVSPANADQIFTDFKMNNAGLSSIQTGRIATRFENVVAGTERSRMEFSASENGTLSIILRAGFSNTGVFQFGFGPSLANRQTYSASNVTTDRTFDADTVAVAELADVVGTLISDLRNHGVVL